MECAKPNGSDQGEYAAQHDTPTTRAFRWAVRPDSARLERRLRGSRRSSLAGRFVPVLLRVRLLGVRHVRTAFACVADAVVVRIALACVAYLRAIIARVSDSVRIGVALICVGGRRTIITGVSTTIIIPVRLRRVEEDRTIIHGVGHPVSVSVVANAGLIGVRIIDKVLKASVKIALKRVSKARALNGYGPSERDGELKFPVTVRQANWDRERYCYTVNLHLDRSPPSTRPTAAHGVPYQYSISFYDFDDPNQAIEAAAVSGFLVVVRVDKKLKTPALGQRYRLGEAHPKANRLRVVSPLDGLNLRPTNGANSENREHNGPHKLGGPPHPTGASRPREAADGAAPEPGSRACR